MPANLENSAVATGLEKVSFHSSPKEEQCQRPSKLLHNCTHFTCLLTVWSTTNMEDSSRNGNTRPPACLLRNLYSGQEATVRTRHGTADWFRVGKGVCQGHVLSPVYVTSIQVDQMVKNPPAVQEVWVRLLIGKIPWRKAWQPTSVFLPGESHGQRSLVGYSPWGHKE